MSKGDGQYSLSPFAIRKAHVSVQPCWLARYDQSKTAQAYVQFWDLAVQKISKGGLVEWPGKSEKLPNKSDKEDANQGLGTSNI